VSDTAAPTGSISEHRKVWRLAGPIILSNVTTPLLGAVDTAVVGHLPDPANIGAVALGATVFSFLYWGFGFLRMGTTGFTAQAFGRGDGVALRTEIGRALLLGAALGLALIVLQAPIGGVALRLLQASAGVEDLTAAYYDIRIWSAPAVLANYVVLGWLLGVQRAGAALVVQLVTNGVNMALDLWFVLGLGWGVPGVAAATLIAECGGAAVGLVLVARHLRTLPGGWPLAQLFDPAGLRQLFAVNLDIFIRTLCLIFGFALFTAKSATLGDRVLAANAVLMHFNSIAAYGLDGFAHAVEALAGGAIGARDRRAYRDAVRTSTLWALLVAGLLVAAYALAGPLLIDVMTGIAAVREIARDFLPWAVVMPLIAVWAFQLDGIYIGATRTVEMRNAMLITTVAYVAALAVLLPWLGNHGLWLALMVFMAARGLTLGYWFPRIERAIAS
jgi:MATE family multidrug resistance protein